MVDYVVIDDNPTPIENIKYLQPDYFAKGYEYVDGGLHPRTREEMDALESYGGEILFTPGDVVYSSSHLIETEPPNLAAEKLLALMEAEGRRLRQAARALRRLRRHATCTCVGDTIVDSYTYCSLIGGMTKTPTFSLQLRSPGRLRRRRRGRRQAPAGRPAPTSRSRPCWATTR